MNTSALISFLALLIIGVALNSSETLPEIFVKIGGIAALVGGIGFAIYIILQVRLLR